jgi:hypothetical protein
MDDISWLKYVEEQLGDHDMDELVATDVTDKDMRYMQLRLLASIADSLNEIAGK